ncbi:hypothetical protein AC579_4948 [Pseudocercospora musae]|uniref:Uncharacterized protein n=1 Tax=Pseudocercospora musae TaxID=113226 RepID=A0A139I9E3_9PEZI|nr:hypothetical protein AC579_4948 [Pseudocercospora musae]
MSKKPEKPTFANSDPKRDFTPGPSTPRNFASLRQRRVQNLSSEDSNSSGSTSSSNSLDLSGLSITTTPGTTITEPDQTIDIPMNLESIETMKFFGINDGRSDQVWKRWGQVTSNFEGDFGSFVKQHLHSLVKEEKCDDGYPGDDWNNALRKIGANDELRTAIIGRPEFDGVRRTKSALEWVEKAIEWRWKWLLHVNKASKARAGGGVPLPTPSGSSLIQVRSLTSMLMGDDVEGFTYNRNTNTVTNAKGESLDYVPFWRGTSRIDAEGMWKGDMRTGEFDISNQCDPSPTDFSGRRAVHYWTPECGGAQIYARYVKKIAGPAGACLIRIEVPKSLLKKQPTLTLRFPNDDFKQLVWSSRQSKDPPKDLIRKIMKNSLLIGDTTTAINRAFFSMKEPKELDEKRLQKLPNGAVMTQFVFGHITGDDLEDELNKLKDKVTLHHSDHPNIILPPMAAETLAPKKGF